MKNGSMHGCLADKTLGGSVVGVGVVLLLLVGCTVNGPAKVTVTASVPPRKAYVVEMAGFTTDLKPITSDTYKYIANMNWKAEQAQTLAGFPAWLASHTEYDMIFINGHGTGNAIGYDSDIWTYVAGTVPKAPHAYDLVFLCACSTGTIIANIKGLQASVCPSGAIIASTDLTDADYNITIAEEFYKYSQGGRSVDAALSMAKTRSGMTSVGEFKVFGNGSVIIDSIPTGKLVP
jgi:hypothetical protein